MHLVIILASDSESIAGYVADFDYDVSSNYDPLRGAGSGKTVLAFRPMGVDDRAELESLLVRISRCDYERIAGDFRARQIISDAWDDALAEKVSRLVVEPKVRRLRLIQGGDEAVH